MSKLSLQFHTMPDEVSGLIEDLLNDSDISVIRIAGSPLRFTVVKDGLPHVDESTRALAFALHEPSLAARSIDEFRLANPDSLVLSIGHVTNNGLQESWLSAMTENKAAIERWRRVARSVRSKTLTGAVAVNPKNGATAPIKGHRFTAGAQKAYMNGILLLPPAGNSVVRIPPTA